MSLEVGSSLPLELAQSGFISSVSLDRGGRRLAFSRGCHGTCNLAVVGIRGGRPTALTAFRDYGYAPYEAMPVVWAGTDDIVIGTTIWGEMGPIDEGLFAVRISDRQRNKIAPSAEHFWIAPEGNAVLTADLSEVAVRFAIYWRAGGRVQRLAPLAAPKGWRLGYLVEAGFNRD